MWEFIFPYSYEIGIYFSYFWLKTLKEFISPVPTVCESLFLSTFEASEDLDVFKSAAACLWWWVQSISRLM
jgi:hypothetical protein